MELEDRIVAFAARIHIGIAYASKRDQNRKWRFTLSCRADTPKRLLEKWSAPNRKPCPAGKTFGVIGPNGLYRTCLHALPERSRFERLQYIGVVAVCYALVAALWTVCMKRQRRGVLRILEVLAVILVALVLACPLGGMLWHFHDMLAGFFPDFWLRKLVGGFVDGLMVGPRLVFYSFPYNLMALIVGYFATTCLNAFFHSCFPQSVYSSLIMAPIGAEPLSRYLVFVCLGLAYFVAFAMPCVDGGKSQSSRRFLAE